MSKNRRVKNNDVSKRCYQVLHVSTYSYPVGTVSTAAYRSSISKYIFTYLIIDHTVYRDNNNNNSDAGSPASNLIKSNLHNFQLFKFPVYSSLLQSSYDRTISYRCSYTISVLLDISVSTISSYYGIVQPTVP